MEKNFDGPRPYFFLPAGFEESDAQENGGPQLTERNAVMDIHLRNTVLWRGAL